MKFSEHKELVSSLREFADWLEGNPKTIELPSMILHASTYVYEYGTNELGYKDYTKVDEFNTRLKMRRYAKVLGSAVKNYSGTQFSLKKKFGPITIAYQTTREAICRKVVKETIEHPSKTIVQEAYTEEVAEWICDDALLKA